MRTLPKSLWRYIQWFALFFALFFTLTAVVQYYFVRAQLYRSTLARLDGWASQIGQAIYSRDRWDLTGYHNAYFEAPLNYYVITRDGLLVDLEGFVPGLVVQTKWDYGSFYDHPISVTPKGHPEVGEPWRILGKRVVGGSVIAGISDPEEPPIPDKILADNLKRFGSTLQQALRVPPRSIDSNIDYAVVDDFGNLKYAFGELPLRTDPGILPAALHSDWKQMRLNGKDYLILFKPILKSTSALAGWVIFYSDLSGLFQLLHSQALFDFAVASVSWAVLVVLAGVQFVTSERRRRQERVTLEEALKRGEGQAIEFKRGFMDAVLAREIAAFANTNAGNLFVGVDDDGTVVGLFDAATNGRDRLLQKVRNITSQTIRPAILPETTFVNYQGNSVLHIFVPRGNQPLYFVEGTVYIRHVESAMKARPEEVEAIIKRFYG